MNNKKSWAIAVVAGVLAPIAIWAASQQFLSPSAAVNCESGGGCNININGGNVGTFSSPEHDTFGAGVDVTTNWIAGSFSSDLSVGGNFTVSGTATISGTTTFSGDVSGVPKSDSSTMSSSATTTACTFLNSSGVTRTVLAVNVVDRGTATSLGSVTWQAGTSTASGANGSSAIVFTKAINAAVTRVSGADVLTTTSTPQLTGYYPWKSGEYWNFISGTTTNAGTCRILYY